MSDQGQAQPRDYFAELRAEWARVNGLPGTPEEMHELLLSGDLDGALEFGSLVHQIHKEAEGTS